MRYLMRSRFVTATFSMLKTFEKRTCVMMSHQCPCLRNFGLNVANGPNSSGLAVDDAGVEVRHRHGRRADGGLRVHLRLVADDGGIRGLQPLAADRERRSP
jgi:hypothetical protein